MHISVKEVSGRPGIREFVRFPFGLYQNSDFWVPPLISREIEILSPETNPAQANAPTALFMAFDKRKPVGRIAAIAHTVERNVEGRFGWFDAIDEPEVSKALFDAAEQWLRPRGATSIRGPMGFTNLDKAGFLISGFDELPTVATIYNYEYYNTHVQQLGFEKAADYIEYEFKVPDQIPEKVNAFGDLITKRYGLHIVKSFSRSEAIEYGGKLFALINETHRNLYGFVLMPESVRDYYVKKYIPFINPDFIALVMDQKDELVAYGLTMPSLSKAFQKARGQIFPFGFRHISRAIRHVERADLLLIGVSDAYRNKGVTALIFKRLLNTFIKYGVKYVESNPELESNHQVHALWGDYESRIHKRRRIYQKAL